MNAWQYLKLYFNKKNRKKILLIYIFGLAMCLFMISSTIQSNVRTYNNKKKDWTTLKIVSVLKMVPIDEELVKWIQTNSDVQSVKSVKGIDLFLAHDEKNEDVIGVYHFKISDEIEFKKKEVFLSKELYQKTELEKEYIYMTYEDGTSIKLDKSLVAQGEENYMSTESFRELFSQNDNGLPTISLEITVFPKTDMNAFEKELLQRGLKLEEQNSTGLVLSENLGVLQYLFYSIIVLNLVISIIVVIRLCKEDKRDYAIMKIHGYQNRTLLLVQLLKYYVVLFCAFAVALIAYLAILLSMKYIGHLEIVIESRNTIISLLELMGFELIFGGSITTVICFMYSRFNYLSMLKQSK